MALYFTSLNSGSNGNCYYIGNDTEAVLIDTGISCKETEKRMLALGLDMQKIKAIFISHEHTDHIKGLPVIAEKYQLPVYITSDTYKKSRMQLEPSCLQWLKATEKVTVGSLCITAFSKCHDAEDPHSFIITDNGLTVGVFTDIGVACSNVTKHFKRCHAAFLEANYDDLMLENGNYPYFLKNRIRGGQGHLSNAQALDIFKQHRAPFLSHLLLSHLSKDNNDPVAVQQLFEGHSTNTKIIVASRYEASEIFTLEHNPLLTRRSKLRQRLVPSIQMGLFD